jgi:hypothetical protein
MARFQKKSFPLYEECTSLYAGMLFETSHVN